MYPEDDLLPISALQHLLFCERQCALIHIERLWTENRLTVEGQRLHRRAHEAGANEWRDRLLTARGLCVRSLRLGLFGQADVVEFNLPLGLDRLAFLTALDMAGNGQESIRLPAGCSVTPIEYKRGQPKKNYCDKVQLCAQAICLEEMLGVSIASGAIFYGKRRRRQVVAFDPTLRQIAERAARRLHELVANGATPAARREPKCDACSLLSLCMPDAMHSFSSAAFVEREFAKHLASHGPDSDPFESQEPVS